MTFSIRASARSFAALALYCLAATWAPLAAAQQLSIADVSITEGNSGSKLMTFTVKLSATSATAVRVDVATANGSATSGSDYVASATPDLRFPPGTTSKTFTVPILGDTASEPNETLSVNLTNPVNATIADAQAIGTITNDDAAVTPALSVSDASMLEGNSGTKTMSFVVSLSAPSANPVTYDIATCVLSATPGVDYVASNWTPQTIPAGSISKTFDVVIYGDTVIESDETFCVTISNYTGATLADGSGAGWILADDFTPSLSVADVEIVEGNSGDKAAIFTVSLSQATSHDVSFDIATSDVSATAGVDYVAVSRTGEVIQAGLTSATFAVWINGDATVEPNEYFRFDVSNVEGALVSNGGALAAILNDDTVPIPTLSIEEVSVAEGNTGTTFANFTVTLSEPAAGDVTFSARTSDETATANNDYMPQNWASVVIPAGSTSHVLSVPVIGDTVAEPLESFKVTVDNAVGATAESVYNYGLIVDDDSGAGGGTTLVHVGDATVVEGNSGLRYAYFPVWLSEPAAGLITLNAHTSPLTATPDDGYGTGDYYTGDYGLQFQPGSTEVGIMVAILGDSTPEPDETFTLTLTDIVGATAGHGVATATIVNDDSGPPGLTIGDVSIAEGDAGTKTMTFTVSLSVASASVVTYDIATADQTATAGSDYIASSLGGQSIPAGQTSKTFAVTINGDTAVELNETFAVNVSNVVGATLLDGQAIGTISKDDIASGPPTMSIADVSITEGHSGGQNVSFTVTLSHPIEEHVEFNYATADGTATAGSDYVGRTGWTYVPAGATSVTFGVLVNGDIAVESDEVFTMSLSNVSNATLADGVATATIINDDTGATPTISIGDVTIVEGNSGNAWANFTVALSTPAATDVTYNVATSSGTAIGNVDYVSQIGGNHAIPAGMSTLFFQVPVIGDTTPENDETFTVTLSNIVGADAGDVVATGTIINDDVGSPVPDLSIGDVSISEGNSGTKTATFTVSLSAAAPSTVTFDVANSNISAVAGSDFVAMALTGQTIAVGQTSKTVSVTINGDTTVEPDETFTVSVSNVSGATVADGSAIGTITNDDTASGPALSIGDVTITEGNSGTKVMTFTITQSAVRSTFTKVDVATANGSATAGSDYVAASMVGLRIPAGATSKTFNVTINGDTASESDETFTVNLSNAVGAAISDGQAVGTITNDDAAATPTLSIGDVTIAEGNAGTSVATFTVSLSPTASGTVTYDIATSNGSATAGSDFVAASLTGQTISAGATSKTFAVTINGDTTTEPNETFTVTLSNVSGATLGDGSATGTISNDDSTGGGTPTLSIGDVSLAEGNNLLAKQMTFTVTLSAPATTAVTYTIATANGTAVAPGDYTAKSLSGQSIPAGTTSKTFVVAIKGDTVAEPNETFTVNVSAVTGATIADGSATGTITNDDAGLLKVARYDARGLVDDIDDGNRQPQVTKNEYALLLLDSAKAICERTNAATVVGIDNVENSAVLRDLADTANATCANKPRYQAVMSANSTNGFLVEATSDTDAKGATVLGAPISDASAKLTSLTVQVSGHERPLTVLLPNALSTEATQRTAQLSALGKSVNATLKSDPQARLVLIGGVTVKPLLDLSLRDQPKAKGQTAPAERILVSPALLQEFGQSKVEFVTQAKAAATQVLQLQR